MSAAGEPRWGDDADDPDQSGAPRLRALPAPGDDGMVAEAVWHGGGAEKDFDALLRLVFDPIMERLHDAERAADDEGDSCPW